MEFGYLRKVVHPQTRKKLQFCRKDLAKYGIYLKIQYGTVWVLSPFVDADIGQKWFNTVLKLPYVYVSVTDTWYRTEKIAEDAEYSMTTIPSRTADDFSLPYFSMYFYSRNGDVVTFYGIDLEIAKRIYNTLKNVIFTHSSNLQDILWDPAKSDSENLARLKLVKGIQRVKEFEPYE